jgi:RNA 2',3'-cyclic 3'-phosphodiesterase
MPASPETWRCFVAVPAPAELRAALAAAVAGWRAEPDAPDLRWTDPEGWHVTVAFLGPVDPGSVSSLGERIAVALQPFARVEPIRAHTGRVGAFPRPKAAQSVWLGIEDPDRHLVDLARAVQDALLPSDAIRRLRAHLTLGRSRVRRGEPLDAWLATRTFPPTELVVEDVVLFRSHLGRGPATYEELARLPLGGAGSKRG